MKRILTAICIVMTSMALNAQDLTILHMNDTHSHVDPQRSGDYKGRGGVIEHAAYIDSVRCADGKRNVLLVHAGDFSQGTSYFTELGGNIEIELLNTLGFDAVTLGNHEFDNGIDELARRLKSLEPAVVCANYSFDGTVLEDLVEPFVIIRRGGKKIGVIGLLTDISEVVDSDIAKTLTYQNPVDVVNRLAAYLKDEKKCDLVMCLSHLGYGEDKELASLVRNLDLIVGGHSHTLLDDKQVVKDLDGEDVIIVQNWKWGLNVGNLSVDF
jgi:5'-nucleotidase